MTDMLTVDDVVGRYRIVFRTGLGTALARTDFVFSTAAAALTVAGIAIERGDTRDMTARVRPLTVSVAGRLVPVAATIDSRDRDTIAVIARHPLYHPANCHTPRAS